MTTQLYVNQANIVFQDTSNNDVIAYFFEDKITLVIRTENISESYIFFCAYDKEALVQDARDLWASNEYDVIRGDIGELDENAQ